MFDIGGAEFLMIGLAILLLFGPKKIPEVMHSIGKGIRYFRKAQEDLKSQIRDISTEVEKQTNITNTIVSESPSQTQIDTTIVESETQTFSIRPAEGSLARNVHIEGIQEDSSQISDPNPQKTLEQGE